MTDNIVENILKERYYQPGESSWEDIAKRVAKFVANNSEEESEFLSMISDMRFLPNSPCLMNAGTDNPQMSACFTIPVGDSIPDIFDAVKYAAIIHKSGGGTGFNFSDIRPKNSIVGGTGGVASGPVSFISVFNSGTETIKQGSKRRGANLGSLDVDHPDIEEFIKCKEIEGQLSNFNISVNITDDFMDKVVAGVSSVQHIWNLIVDGNWKNGEPGVIFLDRAELDNTCKHLGKVKYRNPCQEFVGLAWESCNLGSLNGVKYFINGKFDYKLFEHDIRYAVRFLNNVIDKNAFPLSQIKDATQKTRKIGLGLMGFADLLILMDIRYGSSESVDFAKELTSFMRRIADNESVILAEYYGTYPESRGDNRRNASVLSIAPTGTISLLAGCSSSIEPNFAYVTNRSTWVDGNKKTYKMLHPIFQSHLSATYTNDEASKITNWMFDNGTIQNCPYVSNATKRLFVTAIDVSPDEHIKMQATFQNNGVDQSISNTINCPNSTTKEQISDMIISAWKSGCKGLTIYREGSRDDVVLETNASNKSDEMVKLVEVTNPVKYKLVTANGRVLPKTPREMPATLVKKNSGCGKMMIAIGEAFGGPHSVTIVNKGGCDAMTQALAELTALALRWGIPGTDIVKTLKGIKCSAALKNPNSDGKSCPDILGKVIDELYEFDDMPDKKDKVIEVKPKHTKQFKISCPECGESLIFESGCVSCSACGYSRCG